MSHCGLRGIAEPENCALPHATQEASPLKKRLFKSLSAQSARTVRVRKHCNVYTCGDADQNIYWIQSGYIKIAVSSTDGKECILDIYATGDFFGEACLAGRELRAETATAMESSILRSVDCQRFTAGLGPTELLTLSQELARRNTKQQMIIADMVTMSSELRLGRTLLRLGSDLGKRHSSGTLIHCRISQDELSCIVGTTRPRITEFMTKFRRLDLIHLNADRQIIVKEDKLMTYLSALAQDRFSDSGPILDRPQVLKKRS